MRAVSNNIESDAKQHYVTTTSLKQKEVNSETKELEPILDQNPDNRLPPPGRNLEDSMYLYNNFTQFAQSGEKAQRMK